MSMQRLAVMAAVGTHMSMKNRTDDIRYNKYPHIETQERPNGTSFHGDVNILLGGAMLSFVTSIVCFVCYCCHRSQKKRAEVIYRQRWLDVDPNMDIYSVEQYYDISANIATDNDQYANIMRNQGPPPSYDIAVAMKKSIPINCQKCQFCRNRIDLSCLPEANHMKICDEYVSDKRDNMISQPQPPKQLLDIRDFSQQPNGCRCDTQSLCLKSDQSNDFGKACQMCDEAMSSENNNLNEEDIQNGNSYQVENCQCLNESHNGSTGRDIHTMVGNLDPIDGHDTNYSVPSTSGDARGSRNSDFNSNYEENHDEQADCDSLNENGLIRVNMSQIIDQTGLPTYEAALKLESSGYV